MTKQQALEILYHASGLAQLSRADHIKVETAYETLKPLTDENSNNKPK